MKTSPGWFLVFVIAPFLAAECCASIVTIPFQGTITIVTDSSAPIGNVGGIVVGSAFSGTFSFETSTTDLDNDPNNGLYLTPNLVAFDLLIGGVQFVGNSSTMHGLIISNNADTQFGNNTDVFDVTQQVTDPAGWSSASPFGRLDVLFFDTTGTVFTDDTIPGSLTLSDFDLGFINLRYLNVVTFPGGSESEIDIIGEINLSAIPEPSSVSIVCLILMGGLGMRRRYQASNEVKRRQAR